MDAPLDSVAGSLGDYPRPSVAVDTAVFTVEGDELCVALVEGPNGRRRLPGTFLHEGETLVDAVRRSLREKAGIVGGAPQQLRVFDEPDRDERGWVLSVAHALALPAGTAPASPLVPIDRADPLDFDHGRILAVAVERIRGDYATRPDPWGLLPGPFTLRDLLRLHSAVDPSTPQRDTFRRMMEPQLVATGEVTSGTVGKPSRLFRRPSDAEVQQRRAEKIQLVWGGSRRTSRSRLDDVPTDRMVTQSSRVRDPEAWVPREALAASTQHVIELDRGPAGVVARAFSDERAALWAFRGLVTTFERLENRVGPDELLRAVRLIGPGGAEVSRQEFG
jgi:8-oxo-dGTP diphosphatase